MQVKHVSPWPAAIIACFTLAVIGCGTFIAFCCRRPAELVATDYYEQEVRYQGQIDRIQRARQGAQRASLRYDPAERIIRISLPPNSANGIVTGNIQLYRPSAVNQDRQLKLETDAKGVQTIDAGTLLPGLWKIRITWTAGEQNCFLDEKVVIAN